MIAAIRQCAESHDIKGLRYIFVDCLDVDPTFEDYQEDYEYCKLISGMFDDHRELTELSSDVSKWTTRYWDQLKLDLMKNFSQKRFEYMVKIAKVVYADKVDRLLKERSLYQNISDKDTKKVKSSIDVSADKKQVKVEVISDEKKNVSETAVKKQIGSQGYGPNLMSEEESQEARLARKKREIDEANRKAAADREAQNARIQASRIELEKEKERNRVDGSKKAMGIGLTIILILVIVAGVLLVIALQ